MFFVLAFFMSVFVALAAPVPQDGSLAALDKRVTHTGRGTWFEVGLGNCGITNTDSDPIVAIAKSRYDANDGANCGQWIQITDTANGKTAYGLTRDSCQSCGDGDLDMSPSLFEKFASLDVGELSISWNFMNKDWSP